MVASGQRPAANVIKSAICLILDGFGTIVFQVSFPDELRGGVEPLHDAAVLVHLGLGAAPRALAPHAAVALALPLPSQPQHGLPGGGGAGGGGAGGGVARGVSGIGALLQDGLHGRDGEVVRQ